MGKRKAKSSNENIKIIKTPAADSSIIELRIDEDIFQKLEHYSFNESDKLRRAKYILSVDIENLLVSFIQSKDEKNVKSSQLEQKDNLSYEAVNEVEVNLLKKIVSDSRVVDKNKKLSGRNKKFYEKNEHFDQLNSYLEKHLIKELQRTVYRLGFEAMVLGYKGKERESQIKLILDTEEMIMRNRLATSKGRIPTKLQDDFEVEKENFINRCIQAFQELDKRNKKLIKSQLAEILFQDLNPQQSLRRKFKDFGISFEDVLEKYSEQKSS